jgi:hypothetical protein
MNATGGASSLVGCGCGTEGAMMCAFTCAFMLQYVD